MSRTLKINRYLLCMVEIDRADTFLFVFVLLYYFVSIVRISMFSLASFETARQSYRHFLN